MYDKIIHFHIAKTGGTSLNNWLDTLVPACRARPVGRVYAFQGTYESVDGRAQRLLDCRGRFHPLHRSEFDWATNYAHLETASAPIDYARAYVRLSEFGRDARAYWDVAHDHCPAIATLDSDAYRIVLLRDPVDRCLSFLRDWRRLSDRDLPVLPPKAQSLRRAAIYGDANAFVRFLSSEGLGPSLTQTRVLMNAALHGLPHDFLETCDPAPLALATSALDSLFDLVGVVDRMDDVVQCIARDVGACPIESLGRYNQGAADPERDSLSTESLAILRQVYANDFKLYAKARAMLEARLLPTYSQADFEAQHLERRLQQLTPRFVDGRRVFSLNDQIIGCGFHGRDAADTTDVSVWSGPGNRTVLYVPVPPGERLDLHVDIGGYVQPSVGESMRIRVDDRDRAFQRTAARGVLERIVVPVQTSRPHCKVELVVERTFTPAEAGHADGDARRLGVALRGYGYRLTLPEGVVMRQVTEAPSRLAKHSGPDGMPGSDTDTDALWIRQMTTSWLDSLATESDQERLIDLLTWGVPQVELNAPPTADGVERAFQRLLMRPAPQEWLDFWVGRPAATLRQLYRDLMNAAEFQQRRGRMGQSRV
jgi:hypothetical protein